MLLATGGMYEDVCGVTKVGLDFFTLAYIC